MTRTVTNQAQVELAAGVILVSQLIEGTYHNGTPYSYTSHDLEGLSDNKLDNLAKLATVLQNLPEEGALDFDVDELEEFIKDWLRKPLNRLNCLSPSLTVMATATHTPQLAFGSRLVAVSGKPRLKKATTTVGTSDVH